MSAILCPDLQQNMKTNWKTDCGILLYGGNLHIMRVLSILKQSLASKFWFSYCWLSISKVLLLMSLSLQYGAIRKDKTQRLLGWLKSHFLNCPPRIWGLFPFFWSENIKLLQSSINVSCLWCNLYCCSRGGCLFVILFLWRFSQPSWSTINGWNCFPVTYGCGDRCSSGEKGGKKRKEKREFNRTTKMRFIKLIEQDLNQPLSLFFF